MESTTLQQAKSMAIPAFVLLILVEYLISKKQNKNLFKYSNSLANLCIGIAERTLDLFITVFFFYIFTFIKENFALFYIKSGWLSSLLLFVLIDFVWYWYHRLSHEVNIFWSAHIVHHQSEDYNYTVSARITVFQAIIRNIFWCFFPLLGFPAEALTVSLLIHGLYPFFLHTQLIGKLGWLEYLFVTPSHHRVHHGSNDIYLDKNYGDVLIIWDKLFKTFQVETEKPVYGITKPLSTYSFLWQQFHQIMEVFYEVKNTIGLKSKVLVLLGKPDLIRNKWRSSLENKYLPEKARLKTKSSFSLKVYVIAQLLLSLLFLFVLSYYFDKAGWPVRIISSCIIIITLINICALLEQRKWIFYLEYIRCFIVQFFILYWYNFPEEGIIVSLYSVVVLTTFFKSIQKLFYNNIYGDASIL